MPLRSHCNGRNRQKGIWADFPSPNTIISTLNMKQSGPLAAIPRTCSFLVTGGVANSQLLLVTSGRALRAAGVAILPAAVVLFNAQDEVYNVLWALVFAFATINILGLGVRHLEPNRRGLSMGEILAVMVVLVSVLLLGWEMLYLFHVLPIRLAPR